MESKANDKVYDGSNNATVIGGVIKAFEGDDVRLDMSSVVAVFADKNVGVGKPVKVTGFKLVGADAGNYALEQPSGLTANISPCPLTISGVSVKDKVFDGTTHATLVGGKLQGVFPGDRVTLVTTWAVAVFADKNIGNAKPVIVSGLAITGPDARNYVLNQPSGLTASILNA